MRAPTVLFLLHLVTLAQPKSDTKVLGGSPTTIDRYPILAQLLLDSLGNQQFSQYCAGVILTARHVISTAHCYQYNNSTGKDFSNPSFWRIRVGSSHRTRGGTLLNVKSFVRHPSFDRTYYNYDIAVIVAARVFPLGTHVRQGTIPKQGTVVKPSSMATLVGWGVSQIGGSQPDQLQYVHMRTIDQETCRQRYTNISAKVTEAMMCAGLLDQAGVDGCYGDSGGPLLYNGVVVGLMSFGYVCGHHYFPGVYTRISHFSDWILQSIYSNG